MSSNVESTLKTLQLEVPAAAAPAANYVPYSLSCGQVFVSGQLPKDASGTLATGKVGRGGKSVQEAQEAARWCALNILGQLKAAAGGNLDQVKKIVKITVFVNSQPDFTEQHLVANGASDLLVSVFGEGIGRHARCAVGVPALPLDALVEVEAIAEL